MNIRQLQLDDLVLYSGKVCRVTAVRLDNDGKVRAVVENDNFCGFVDEIEPIPLTAEILEKNGWIYEDFNNENSDDELYYVYNGFDIHINTDKFEIRCIDAVNIELKYVHELQNTLKLMKIEKEIEL